MSVGFCREPRGKRQPHALESPALPGVSVPSTLAVPDALLPATLALALVPPPLLEPPRVEPPLLGPPLLEPPRLFVACPPLPAWLGASAPKMSEITNSPASVATPLPSASKLLGVALSLAALVQLAVSLISRSSTPPACVISKRLRGAE